MPEETLVTKGLIERIGIKDSIFTIEVNGEKLKMLKISRIMKKLLTSC